ncbi:MAG: 2OG-Fe(II) oxygenase [Methylovirgula sp.]
MTASPAAIAASFCNSLSAAKRYEAPYPHLYAEGLFPEATVAALADLPLAAEPSATSGKRENNALRIFFGATEMARFPIMWAVAEALQSRPVTTAITRLCGALMEGSYLRLEYAIDTDGFWLAPHTDIGVKKFTCLISLADDDSQSSLGTDIYNVDNRLYKRAPFHRNGALMFVPSHESLHGFAPRPIRGRRKSIILNYVGPEWRAKDQLAFPDAPISLL